LLKLKPSLTEDIFNLYSWSNKWPLEIITKLLDILKPIQVILTDMDWEDESLTIQNVQYSDNHNLSIYLFIYLLNTSDTLIRGKLHHRLSQE